ncbi:hypothetical protein [Streptomyces sp. NPDC049555]|uniref:hypothetical protein n=1 Tax=Streptomyces sp. NPDC049555 TaxID=3154930 RepID=UPI0034207203
MSLGARARCAGTQAVKESTLHPPYIAVSTWWMIAAIVTALFLVVCVPLMPSRKYKVRIACAPLLGLVFLAVAGAVRDHETQKLLSTYCTVMFAIPLGIVGRGKELKEAAEEAEKAIGGQVAPAPFKLTMQLSAALVGACMLWVWLNWG